MSIEEVANLFSITTSQLRYYEKHKIIINIARNQSGHRTYTEENLAWIEFVLLLKNLGMSLSEIKLYVTLKMEGQGTVNTRKQMLMHHLVQTKKEIAEKLLLQEKLQYIVDNYNTDTNFSSFSTFHKNIDCDS